MYTIDYNHTISGVFKKRSDAVKDLQVYAFSLQRNGARLMNQRKGSFDFKKQLPDGNWSDKIHCEVLKLN